MRGRTVVFWLVAVGFLLAGVLLTTTRAFEPAGGWWVRLEAFTPLGHGLLRRGARRPRSPGSRTGARPPAPRGVVLALAGLALHVWWFAPMVTGANPPAPDGAEHAHGDDRQPVRRRGRRARARRGGRRRRTSTCSSCRRSRQGCSPTMESGRAGGPASPTGRASRPTRGEGTMIFAREPLEDVRRLDTTWGGWQVTTGGLTAAGRAPGLAGPRCRSGAATTPRCWRPPSRRTRTWWWVT